MTRAADDFAAIATRQKLIRGHESGVCGLRDGSPATACWCFGAGPGGRSLQCPPAPPSPAAPKRAAPISSHRLAELMGVPWRTDR